MFFLCGCACLFLSDLLAYGYVVMMLNVLRSDITIKNSTLTFLIPNKQRKVWIIARLLPHIHLQSDSIKIAMKLEASLVAEIIERMDQVQSQLVALTIQLQEIAKGKEKCK